MQEIHIKDKTIKLKESNEVWMPTRFGIALGELILEGARPNPRVLELGVGSGVLSILCGVWGTKVTALDINMAALELTEENWKLNGLPQENLEVRYSDLFSGMDENDVEGYSLLFSNPPTFPGLPPDYLLRKSRDEWEFAGNDGRLVLDAVITQGSSWLKTGGRMVTIATSKQGWNQTVELMDKHWKKWKILRTEDLPLADYYDPYIELWVQKSKKENQVRIFKKNGKWQQRLYFIEAFKN